jgi:hypothetical protein
LSKCPYFVGFVYSSNNDYIPTPQKVVPQLELFL